ncbi:MAG: Gmad2 immunoglobulin-like domain-containing protein [Bacteroidota bacterium]
MKQTIYLSVLLLLLACTPSAPQNPAEDFNKDTVPSTPSAEIKEESPGPDPVQKYANERFRDVTVVREGDSFRVRGQAQVFEAAFSWVVEDGHNQVQKGFEMTDAGAPEWGNFDFKVTVSKKRPDSALTLVLFEASAMDGSPQHELSVVLAE